MKEYETMRQLQEEQPDLWAEMEKMRARGMSMSMEDMTEMLEMLRESLEEE
jgi:hypothetical protein